MHNKHASTITTTVSMLKFSKNTEYDNILKVSVISNTS